MNLLSFCKDTLDDFGDVDKTRATTLIKVQWLNLLLILYCMAIKLY